MSARAMAPVCPLPMMALGPARMTMSLKSFVFVAMRSVLFRCLIIWVVAGSLYIKVATCMHIVARNSMGLVVASAGEVSLLLLSLVALAGHWDI